MLLRYFYDEALAQASYLVGCAKTGEAMVVDPIRDVEPYLHVARREGLHITHVTETHIHADFVSGLRELVARTGARAYVSDMGDANWKYEFDDDRNVVRLRDGDIWMVGNIRVQALHTPGHTPEHLSFMITDTAVADEPMGVFTGDFLFVGDVGRPDLLEEAAGLVGTKEVGARQQFDSVQRFKALPDYLQIWPGHGAGSACGKALGAIPSTTLGYERRFNPAFRFSDQAAFVRWLLDGQPEPPRYFAQMKRVNKVGVPLLSSLPAPQRLGRAELHAVLEQGALVVDLRPREDYARASLTGTVSIPMDSSAYVTWIGWFVEYDKPLYLILPSEDHLTAVLRNLRNIGVDRVAGYWLPDDVGERVTTLPVWTSAQVAERLPQNGLVLLDVRGKAEFTRRHIRGAKHIPLGFLPRQLASLPSDRWIIAYCSSGYRSLVAASWLRRAGFAQVATLQDSEDRWAETLPVESSAQ